jgi:hypothetical protein
MFAHVPDDDRRKPVSGAAVTSDGMHCTRGGCLTV